MLRTKANWLQNAYQDRTPCGVLRKENIGNEIYLLGWVFRYRDNGGVIFFDMRDHSGIVQVVFERSVDPEMLKLADSVRQEFVVAIKGKVRARGEGLANNKLATGDIEIAAEELIILNKAKTIPFSLEEFDQVGEETRLKHRYMDLRRPLMANMLRKRHELILAFRNYLNDLEFLEVETPILNKSTPEGARDFLVPSRMHPGEFYALPQSPQIFKQILMASGVNRYFQVVKCFRDEDLRADRQPEFTQLDIEMSFVDTEELIGAIEKMWHKVWPKVFGFDVPEKISRITYAESMRRFGVDRPDMRFGIELNDVADIVKDSEFKVFRAIVEDGGMVNAICVPGGAALSRKDIDDLTSWLGKDFGAKGLAWLKHTENGLESVIAKFFNEDQLKAISERLATKQGDIVFFGAGNAKMVYASLGALRLKMAERFELTKWDDFNFVWVTDFPLLEEGDNGEWTSVHHPFTSPDDALLEKIQEIQSSDKDDAAKAQAVEELRKNTEWASVTSKSYDLVLNGHEIGGGSIRIHDTVTQDAVFQLLGMSPEEAEAKFGFLLNALSYGAPPHGGIAFGIDRVLMLGLNFDSIRDVIAFPKTQKGICQMSQAPTGVGIEQLLELGIKLHRD